MLFYWCHDSTPLLVCKKLLFLTVLLQGAIFKAKMLIILNKVQRHMIVDHPMSAMLLNFGSSLFILGFLADQGI